MYIYLPIVAYFQREEKDFKYLVGDWFGEAPDFSARYLWDSGFILIN